MFLDRAPDLNVYLYIIDCGKDLLMKTGNLELNEDRINYGMICGAASYMLWGILPIFWKFLQGTPADEILAHRILWSFVFVLLIIFAKKDWRKFLALLRDRRSMAYIAACSIMITFNWFLFIWCVNNNHIIDSSLGFYINPLMSILLGTAVLKEKLNGYQKAAISIAATGVLSMIVVYGSFPLIPLALATSFGVYGLFKKKISVEPTVGLAAETLVTAPFAAGYIIWLSRNGTGAFGGSVTITILLLFAGVVTAIPLMLFAEGARYIKLSTLGFLQYLSPTISLIIGILLYNEQITQVNMIGFGFIWLALAVYSYSVLKPQRKALSIEENNISK